MLDCEAIGAGVAEKRESLNRGAFFRYSENISPKIYIKVKKLLKNTIKYDIIYNIIKKGAFLPERTFKIYGFIIQQDMEGCP